jgi:hypothetical protein
MGKGEYENVILIDDVVIKRERKSSDTDASKPIAEDRPSIRVSRDPFYRSIDLCSEVKSKPRPAPLVPHARVSVLLSSEPMKADLDCRHRSLPLVS